MATTLNNLGNLYGDTQRLKESEQAFQEALQIRRELAKSNPTAYQPYVAQTLNNLGILYITTGRPKESAVVLEEALHIFQELATSNPAYQPRVKAIKDALDAIAAQANGSRTR